MAKTVAILNQKGGVGKTTTAVNLTACIGAEGKKTLLIDIDPQGNSTSGFGVDKRKTEVSAYEVLVGERTAKEAVIKTAFQNVNIIASNMNLAGAELEIIDRKNRESLLKTAIAPIWNEYDYIFLDCPPSLGLITLNALTCADTFLVPIQCEYYALEGVRSLMDTVNRVKRTFNPHLEIEGILLTMLDGRTNLGLQVVDQVKKHFKKTVFATMIPRNVRLGEAPSHGEPINIYDPRSTGAIAYRALAKEVISRNRGKK